MRLSIKGLFIGLGAFIAVLLFSGLLAYQNTRRIREDAAWVAHTHEVLETLQATLATVTDAETGQRGYLLTQDLGYLQPYQAAVARVQDILQRLRTLELDDPAQTARIPALTALLTAKLDELRRTIALERSDPAAARRMVQTHLGQNLMTAIRAEVAAMDRAERILLQQREERTRQGYRIAVRSGGVFLLLGLGLALGFLVHLARHLRDRARYERTLDQQRQWLQVTLRSIGDGLIATDRAGAVTFMNPVAEALTGWTSEAAAGHPLTEVFRIIDEQTGTAAANPVAKVLREGALVGLANHTALVGPDGLSRPIEDSAAPIADAAGNISGVVLVFHDATGKRRAEAILRQSERRFRNLTELSPDAIWINRNDRIELPNSEALRLLGATRPDQVEGRRPEEIFHADCHGKVRERLRAARNGQVVHQSEEAVVRLDGTVRQVEVSSAPSVDAQGPVIQVVLRDITERKRAEAELQEAVRRRDEFLATLAHELRNPLAPIRTGAYILGLRDTPDPEIRRIHDTIARQSAHMARLVDDLLDVSRIEQGKVALRKERVDLRQVVAHALDACRPLLEPRGHQPTLDLPEPPPELEADPIRLEQMLCNLLNNAAKCTPQGGEIHLSAVREGDEVVLRLRDTGVGMPPEVLAHVFDLFYQADQSLDRPQGGLGLGLTLVQSLALLHGGSVAASSGGPGRGSEFQLRLPAPAPVPASPAPRAAGTGAPGGGRKHVLIVDDDRSVRMTSEMLLTAMNYRVSMAATGEKGVEQAKALRPDIALIDLGMPGLDGLEVAARIRAELGRDIYLVALTGYSRDVDFARTRAAGFDKHLVKSGDPRELLELLQSL
jgi:PAS domain S-box-containing protein